MAVIKRKRTTAEEDYIIIPDYSAIKEDSWSDDSNFVKIPKAAVQSAKGKVFSYAFLCEVHVIKESSHRTLSIRDFILCLTTLHNTAHHTT